MRNNGNHGPKGALAPPSTVIWIDGEQAILARWTGVPTILRVASDVPSHHASTGRVRVNPTTRHGGGGAVEDLIERDRLEHLRHYLTQVAAQVASEDDVEILGPGTVREHLENVLLADDRRHGRRRAVSCRASGPLTERQLVAYVRERAGEPPPRRRVGPLR